MIKSTLSLLKFSDIKQLLNKNLLNIILISLLFNAALNFYKSTFYIRGILIDYLIPQLYINQIIFLIIILIFIKNVYEKYFQQLLMVCFLVFVNLFFSSNLIYSLSFLSKQFIYFLLLLTLFASARKTKINITLVYLINFLYLVILVIQALSNSSVFGYFPFGFYEYNGIAPRLDYIVLFHTKYVAPLGNFPHANVFAAFLSFLNILIYIDKGKTIAFKIIFFVSNLLAIFYLGSISSLIFNLIFVFIEFLKKKWYLLPFLLLVLIIPVALYLYKPVSLIERFEQYKISIYLLSNYITFGVGIGNYIPSITLYEKEFRRIFVLQPVHNVFLLFLVEWGVVISTFILIRLKKYLKYSPFLLFILILGLFDHFLYTLNQGLIMLSLTIYLHKTIIDSKN